MAENVVPLHSDSQPKAETHPTTKRPVLNAESVRTALPYIDAALAALAPTPMGPYAQALRVVTNAGVLAIPVQSSLIVSKMRQIKGELKKLDPEVSKREIRLLNAQLDVCVDLLLELESR